MKIVQWAIRIEICNCKCLTNQNHLRCSNTLRALFTDLRINVLQSKRLLKMSQSQKFDWSTLNRSLAPNLPLTHFPNGFTTSSCIILFYLDYLTTSSVPAIRACLAVVRVYTYIRARNRQFFPKSILAKPRSGVYALWFVGQQFSRFVLSSSWVAVACYPGQLAARGFGQNLTVLVYSLWPLPAMPHFINFCSCMQRYTEVKLAAGLQFV